ncbi:MAG: ATP-binding cassette domain-containing protein [Firmicutes bacterium]|nr:ATP-binding cassette domain-containing protein [Bacillota bacterium]
MHNNGEVLPVPDIRTNPDVILDVKDLKMHFPIYEGLLRKIKGHVRAVDGVDLFVRKGETLGVVGESGCGKTTLGRCILRLLQPTAGQILFRSVDGEIANLTELDHKGMKKYRQEIQVIFQDPFSSLNSRMTVEEIIAEPLFVNDIGNRQSRQDRVAELLDAVGLSRRYMHRYPHEFSGGQRQRIGIARALSVHPELIICDEPVSALDVSIQAQVINLLSELQQEEGYTYIFVAHDLSVIEHISHRVAVMYLGQIVELSETDELYGNPKHPYTEALMAAIPSPDPAIKLDRSMLLSGNVPSPANPPPGCRFHTRCRYAQEKCKQSEPRLVPIADGEAHYVACHRAEELTLRPAPKQALDVAQ